MNEYHIIEKMATGSFGIVFRIRRLIDDAILVLKRIPLEDLDPPQRIQATQELCLMSQLHHPYIVAQRDAFLFNTSDLCLVMDYYDGGDLDALLFTQRGEDSYFDLRTVMLWFVQMLLAVHYLHAHGVIHRDIKSHNIFLNGDHQSVAVGDFGIAEKIDLTKVNGTRRKVVGGGGGAGARPSSSSLSGSPITTDLRHYQVSSTFTPSASISNAHMSQPTLPTQPSPRPDSPNNNNNNNSSSDLLYQTKHNPHNMDSSCHSDFAPSPHLPPSSSSATTTTTTAGGAAPTTTSAAAGGGGGAAGVPFMAMKGTPLYMSPEALQSGVSSGPKSDVWALGCIVYELLSLRHPFETRDLGALVLRVTSGDRDPLPPHYPPAVHELVDAMLSVDEQQRPTCEELLHMPLVAAYLRLLLALRVPSDVPSCDVEKSLAKQLRHLGPTPPGAPSCTTYEHMMKEPECLPSVARERAERHQLIPPSSAFFHCGSSATSLRTSAGAFSFSVPQPSDAGRGGEMMMMSSNNRNNSPPRPSRSPVSSPRPPPPPQRQPHDRALVSSNDTSSFSNRQPLPPPQQVQQQQHQHQHQSQQSQQQQQQVSRRRRSSAVSPIVFTPAMMMEVEVANAAEAEEAEWVFCHHPNVVDLRGADVPTLVAEARRLRALIQGELRLQQQRRGMEELRTKFGDLFVELMQPARRQSSTRAMLGIRGDDDGDLHMHRAVSANNDGCTPRPNTHPPWPPPPSSAHSSARDDDLPAYARHQQQQQHVVAAASTLHDGLRSTSTAAAAALAFRDVAASHTFFGATLHAHLAPYLVRRARLVEHILLLLTPTQLDGVYSYYMQHNLARRSPRAVREIVPDRRAWQVLPTVEELVVVDVFLGRQLATKHNAQPAAEVEWG